VKFLLVDQILDVQPGKSIRTAKAVSQAEEYLGDHFPGFPVLPGVLMLEAAVQSAAWLVRQQNDFAHSLIVLKEARGVRYGTFVSPGNTLIIQADAVKITETESDFKIKGTVNGSTAVIARLILAHLNVGDVEPALASADEKAIAAQRLQWTVLYQNAPLPALPGSVASI
jgi:3-hydroxyacyl-[acyl-carrier-protein] dehydratase